MMAAERRVEIPDEVDIAVDDAIHRVTVSGDEKELSRRLDHPAVTIEVDGNEVVVSTDSKKRDHAAIVGTYASHIQNMIDGVRGGYEYRLKSFYAHFPMDFNVQGNEFVIKNFIGERAPRHISIPDGVNVQVDDEDVVVTGADKEKVGQTAANIEQACYKGNRDPRKFQDGIYITEKKVVSDE